MAPAQQELGADFVDDGAWRVDQVVASDEHWTITLVRHQCQPCPRRHADGQLCVVWQSATPASRLSPSGEAPPCLTLTASSKSSAYRRSKIRTRSSGFLDGLHQIDALFPARVNDEGQIHGFKAADKNASLTKVLPRFADFDRLLVELLQELERRASETT